MISLADVYHVLEAIVPLYVAMILAYISIKRWKLFTHEQCSGINKFVAKFSVPLLSFHVISTNNPYQMNLKLLLSDVIQKALAFFLFAILCLFSSRGNLDWLITGFSLSTLPNTLIMGIPLLKAMYGDEAVKLMSQIVVLQSLIWYTILLCLFEFRAAGAMMATPIQNMDVEGEAEAPGGIQIKPAGGEATTLYPKQNKTRFIWLMVGRTLVKNPNTCASLAGLIWALVSFRWRKELPPIVNNSISILSEGGLGMAMVSIGLFMASQSRIIACGTWIAVLSIGIRFIMGPGLMAISSYATGMRGKLLSVAIIQAALPQGIVPFVFAKEYNAHPDILSTGVIIGMLIEIPIALAYYFLLDPK